MPPGPYADDAVARPALAAAFKHGYREKFGRAPPEVPLEFINARVSVRVAVSGGQIAELSGAAGQASGSAVKGQRRAWFAEAGGFVDATVYDHLFGCDRDGPFARHDQAGLLWLLNGDKLVTLSENTATIETSTAARHTYRLRPSGPGRVLVWELGCE